jgi:hypothetical protein
MTLFPLETREPATDPTSLIPEISIKAKTLPCGIPFSYDLDNSKILPFTPAVPKDMSSEKHVEQKLFGGQILYWQLLQVGILSSPILR